MKLCKQHGPLATVLGPVKRHSDGCPALAGETSNAVLEFHTGAYKGHDGYYFLNVTTPAGKRESFFTNDSRLICLATEYIRCASLDFDPVTVWNKAYEDQRALDLSRA